MSRSVRISWKTAQALLRPEGTVDYQRAAAELSKALAPKKFVKAARKEKTAKKRTKRDETAAIRQAVVGRASGLCESCGDLGTDLDHMFGRIRVKQSDKVCWLLCRTCHRQKTDNRPCPELWLQRFVDHCARHGYGAERRLAENRLESLSLSQQSEGRT